MARYPTLHPSRSRDSSRAPCTSRKRFRVPSFKGVDLIDRRRSIERGASSYERIARALLASPSGSESSLRRRRPRQSSPTNDSSSSDASLQSVSARTLAVTCVSDPIVSDFSLGHRSGRSSSKVKADLRNADNVTRERFASDRDPLPLTLGDVQI